VQYFNRPKGNYILSLAIFLRQKKREETFNVCALECNLCRMVFMTVGRGLR
jgi:hypothetical protein